MVKPRGVFAFVIPATERESPLVVSYYSVRFHELLEFNGAVGGGGGREFCCLDTGCFFAVFFVELVGGGACAKDALDFRFGEECGDVVGYDVFDARVASPDDGATVENVPKGDVVL